MYVRIIDRLNGHSTLYDCKEIVLNRFLKSDDDFILRVDILGEGICKSLEINKKYEEIYVMNDDGKTIESHRWPDLRKGENKKDDNINVIIDNKQIEKNLKRVTYLKENL